MVSMNPAIANSRKHAATSTTIQNAQRLTITHDVAGCPRIQNANHTNAPPTMNPISGTRFDAVISACRQVAIARLMVGFRRGNAQLRYQMR